MAKKKDNTQMYWIIGVIAIIVLAYGGSQGWFKSSLTIAGDTINQLEQPRTQIPGETCSISITPSIANSGDLITGTITASPRVFCETYAKYEGVWQKIWEGNTDINGRVTDSENIFLTGDFIFKAICGSCITNEDNLKINPLPSTTCIDSDGKNKLVAGHVTFDGLSYYDACIGNSVNEFFCNGDVMANEIIPCDIGYSCFETRSGGYCLLDDVGHNVGDIVNSGSGSGTSTGDGDVEMISLSEGDNPCTLGIRINARWDSWNDNNYPAVDGECFNPNYQDWQQLYWSFQDSTALRWSDVTFPPPPKALYEDICPAIWTTSGTPWQIQIHPAYDSLDFPPPGCEVSYSYDWEVYNCECP